VNIQIHKVLRLDRNVAVEQPENLPIEKEFSIFVNDDLLTTAMITPSLEREFVAGHLRSEGVIENVSQIKDLKIEDKSAWALIDPVDLSVESTKPGESAGGTKSGQEWNICSRAVLENLESALSSELHLKTGGTHTSALCLEANILTSAEDVGRLNTLDKVFGWGLLEGVDLNRCYVVTSGRITGRTIKKVARFEVTFIASKGAVTTLAAELARERGLTLVGFAREDRMSVYTGKSRLKW